MVIKAVRLNSVMILNLTEETKMLEC